MSLSSDRANAADDVKGIIAAASAAGQFGSGVSIVPQRVYIPGTSLKDIPIFPAPPMVKVVPASEERDGVSRRSSQRDIVIHVGIQQRLPPGVDPESEEANTTGDAIMAIAEAIADLFKPQLVLPTGNQPAWIKTDPNPIYDPDHLRTMRAFTMIVAITFRLVR